MTYKEMAERADREQSAVVLTPVFKTFGMVGDSILGRYMSAQEVKPSSGEGQPYRDYVFETDEGLVRFHLGAQTDKELSGAMFIGGVYRITYREEVKLAKGRRTKKYDVVQVQASPQKSEQSSLNL